MIAYVYYAPLASVRFEHPVCGESLMNIIYIYTHLYIYVIMKIMSPSSYHYNSFMATHALKHMLYSYTFLVPINQKVLNKLSKELNISGHK